MLPVSHGQAATALVFHASWPMPCPCVAGEISQWFCMPARPHSGIAELFCMLCWMPGHSCLPTGAPTVMLVWSKRHWTLSMQARVKTPKLILHAGHLTVVFQVTAVSRAPVSIARVKNFDLRHSGFLEARPNSSFKGHTTYLHSMLCPAEALNLR